MPAQDSSIEYKAMFFALPNNLRFMGAITINITLYKGKLHDYKSIYIKSGEKTVANTPIDKSSKWNGVSNEILELNIKDYANNEQDFKKHYKNMSSSFNFRHFDNAYYGSGLVASTYYSEDDKEKFKEAPIALNLAVDKLFESDAYTYDYNKLKNDAENIYKSWGVNEKDNSLLIEKSIHWYNQNYTARLMAIDWKFVNNVIYLSTITIAGKFRSGWNQSNVHSKVELTAENINFS